MLRYIYSFVLSLGSLTALAQDPAPKLAVPDDAAQKTALSVVADVYKPDYEKAKTPAQKIELAKKLLEVGAATKDDAIGRFVLFRVARDIAAQQGDLATAFEAIGRIAQEFDVEQLTMKVDAATTATKALQLPKDHQACAVLLAPLIDDAIAVDRYDHAKSLASLTLGAAREGRDADHLKQMTSKSKEVEEIAAEFEEVKEAKVSLGAKPTDPDANFAMGKFLCLVKGDWQRGVAMLALGSNEDFKVTALLELDEKPDALKLGDGWWKLSDGLEGTAKTRAQIHAAEWYRKALPGLSGLTKTRVERAISSVNDERLSKSPMSPPEATSVKNTKSMSSTYIIIFYDTKRELKPVYCVLSNDTNEKSESSLKIFHVGSDDAIRITLSDPKGQLILKYFKGGQWTGVLTTSEGKEIKAVANRLTYTKWKINGPVWSREVRLWSNGGIDSPDSANRWEASGSKITLRWANGYIDWCEFTPDMMKFQGKNRNNHVTTATRIE